MTDTVFNKFKEFSLSGNYDLVNGDIKLVLLNSEPDISVDSYYSDIISKEITGTGYTAGGISLENKVVTIVPSTNTSIYSADNISWLDSTLSASYAALYQVMGNSTESKLIGYFDFGSTITSENGEFSIQWSTDGIMRVQPTT